jgi:S1-C subfamily serine protease
MNSIEICSKLEDTTYLVTSFTGQEPLSPETTIGLGSGVAINASGDLLTAAHVVTGRIPVKPEDVRDPNVIYLAMRKRDPKFIQYYPVVCGVSIQNEYVKKPLTVDLAILRPVTSRENAPHLRVNMEPIKAGTQVLMAGYPDDMELPFAFDKLLDQSRPEIAALSSNISVAHQLLMIKSGMIGHTNEVSLTDGRLTLVGDVFYVDNAMHSGASGGPIVNMSAEVVGIITQRAITPVGSEEAPTLKVPSGSTIAISARTIRPLFLQHTAGR